TRTVYECDPVIVIRCAPCSMTLILSAFGLESPLAQAEATASLSTSRRIGVPVYPVNFGGAASIDIGSGHSSRLRPSARRNRLLPALRSRKIVERSLAARKAGGAFGRRPPPRPRRNARQRTPLRRAGCQAALLPLHGIPHGPRPRQQPREPRPVRLHEGD